MGTLLIKGMATILVIPLLYLLAGAIGSAVPVNRGWTEPKEGITIFVRTNGVHTWVMVPIAAAGVDWNPVAPPAHLANPGLAGNYLAFGYGNRDFYLNTPTWSDLTVSTAFAAAFGQGPSLMHVEHEWSPQPTEYQRPIVVDHDQYRRLAEHILASFAFDAAGRTKPLLGRGYGPSDMFYEAVGPYNMFRTCNEWTGEALRAAGIRIGGWTPFSQSLMWRLD